MIGMLFYCFTIELVDKIAYSLRTKLLLVRAVVSTSKSKKKNLDLECQSYLHIKRTPTLE
jgi:hypothetical protein